MARTNDPREACNGQDVTDLTRIAVELLKAGETTNSISNGPGIIQREWVSVIKYFVQCHSYIDGEAYDTKEEAAQRWLELKFQGKI